MKFKSYIIISLLLAIASDATAQTGIITDPLLFVYKLHGQTRKYQYTFTPSADSMTLSWGIERNTKWQSGTFTITGKALREGNRMSFAQPIDGEHVTLPDNESYLLISQKAFDSLKNNGRLTYNDTEYRATGDTVSRDGMQLIHVHDDAEGCDMWILDRRDFPVVWEMSNNPLEINWSVSYTPQNR